MGPRLLCFVGSLLDARTRRKHLATLADSKGPGPRLRPSPLRGSPTRHAPRHIRKQPRDAISLRARELQSALREDALELLGVEVKEKADLGEAGLAEEGHLLLFGAGRWTLDHVRDFAYLATYVGQTLLCVPSRTRFGSRPRFRGSGRGVAR